MNYVERFKVPPGSAVKLKDIDPSFKDRHEGHKEAADEIEHYRQKLRELQELLHADGRRSLLICLQALDAGGKDGTINHILGSMNPQGCKVVGFKQPSALELAHDFLWRIHRVTPARGVVTIFNRSHYEDVLIARVHKLVQKKSGLAVTIESTLSRVASSRTTPISSSFICTSPRKSNSNASRIGSTILPSNGKSARPITRSEPTGTTTWRRTRTPLPLQHRACPLVHHPRRPQVVQEPRRCPDRRGAPGRTEDDVSPAFSGYRAHSQRVSLGETA